MKILIAVVVILGVIFLYMMSKNGKMPGDLGVIDGKFAPLKDSPNGVSSQVDGDKYVDPIKVDNHEDFEKVIKACLDYGNAQVVDKTENYVHLIFTTGKMKYKDDVQLYYSMENATVDYWSQSRVGYSDMGLNKERYLAIIKLYNQNK